MGQYRPIPVIWHIEPTLWSSHRLSGKTVLDITNHHELLMGGGCRGERVHQRLDRAVRASC